MKAFRQLVILLSFFFTVVSAANNFEGVTVADSPSTASYSCRSQQQWNDIAHNAKNNGFKSIRISGFDCDSLSRASNAAASAGLTVLAGIWVHGNMAASSASISADLEAFRSVVQRIGSARFKALTIGNEVNDAPGNIINKVNEARSYLRSVGISIPVSTVHEWVVIRDNPVLCNGDFIGANAHAFYDRNTVSADAGEFVFDVVVPSLRRACGPGKTIWITETGWPSRGSSNGKAVASASDAKLALSNINCACRADRSVSVYAFEGDDQIWKGNDWERSFGIFGKYNLGGEVFSTC